MRTSHDFAHCTGIRRRSSKRDSILFTPWNYLVLLRELQWRRIKRCTFVIYFYFFRLTQPPSKLTHTERKNRGTKGIWTTIYLSLFETKAEEPGEISFYSVAYSFIWNNRRSVVNRVQLAKRKVSKQRGRKKEMQTIHVFTKRLYTEQDRRWLRYSQEPEPKSEVKQKCVVMNKELALKMYDISRFITLFVKPIDYVCIWH